MKTELAETMIEDFERGLLSRRQLASHLIGLGAALAGAARAAEAGQNDAGAATFEATGLNHVALNVASVPKSRDWYKKHLGLKVVRESGEDNCFLGGGGGGNDFFLTLFRGDKPGLNHYCYTIREYNPDKAEAKLKTAGLEPRREGNRLYFPDIDGITVQVAGS
jgi:catechol 2,3-dioxygenase-like lactoylglutathione lyase family enzyme